MSEVEVPYGPNSYLWNSPTNKSLGALKAMSKPNRKKWGIEFCKEVVHAWDKLGVPVTGGQPIDALIDDFKRAVNFDVSKMLRENEGDLKNICIVKRGAAGATCNQFFPTMLKTKDISSGSLEGVSIYSYFSDATLSKRFNRALEVLLDFDALSIYSKVVPSTEGCARTWLTNFQSTTNEKFWIRRSVNTKKRHLLISAKELEQLISDKVVKPDQVEGTADHYVIATYNPQKMIMDYPKAWRVLFDGTPATNFPPMVAKFIYLHFAEKMNQYQDDEFIVYDSSAGWGGRLMGVLASGNKQRIRYVGTDPNPDHWMAEVAQTKYEFLGHYFNGNIITKFQNTFEIFQSGSEVIDQKSEFQKYKGKVHFAFTSPPYFAVEGYSDDENQSHIKFNTYEKWVEGFLKKTLEITCDWLKPSGYLCLNIADVRLDNQLLPLQIETQKILRSLGMIEEQPLYMVLTDAPQGSKTTSSGEPTTRNFCRLSGKNRKYEPIFVFRKPE